MQIPPWIPQEVRMENMRKGYREWLLSQPRGKFRVKFNRERMWIRALTMKTSPRRPVPKRQTRPTKQTDCKDSVD